MTYIVESKELAHGIVAEVRYDDWGGNNPREWDNLGTVVLGSRVRYNFGDKALPVEAIDDICRDASNIWLPVYMYDHSGITINTTGFSCPWDSGQVGIIYMPRAVAVANWGKKICTAAVADKARACLRAEVETLDQYLRGEVLAYMVRQGDDVVDSCGGFFCSPDEVMAEAVAAAQYRVEEAERELAEVQYWKERGEVTA
jgi:hypothetical protein